MKYEYLIFTNGRIDDCIHIFSLFHFYKEYLSVLYFVTSFYNLSHHFYYGVWQNFIDELHEKLGQFCFMLNFEEFYSKFRWWFFVLQNLKYEMIFFLLLNWFWPSQFPKSLLASPPCYHKIKKVVYCTFMSIIYLVLSIIFLCRIFTKHVNSLFSLTAGVEMLTSFFLLFCFVSMMKWESNIFIDTWLHFQRVTKVDLIFIVVYYLIPTNWETC